MAKMIGKLVSSVFYLFENAFNAVPISMCHMLKSEFPQTVQPATTVGHPQEPPRERYNIFLEYPVETVLSRQLFESETAVRGEIRPFQDRPWRADRSGDR
jgi:hypothetical protein